MKIGTRPAIEKQIYVNINLLKSVNLGSYHQRMLVSNCVLNIEKIKKSLNWTAKYTNEQMLIECYDHYVSTLDKAKENSSSKKLPNLKLLNF